MRVGTCAHHKPSIEKKAAARIKRNIPRMDNHQVVVKVVHWKTKQVVTNAKK